MKTMTERPHHVGSEFTGEKVAYMAGLFRSWGYEVEVEEFTVLFPTPTARIVELVAPSYFSASLEEPALLASVTGRAVLRFANADVLPFSFEN